MTSMIFGERYLYKVGAVFDDGESAREAADRLTRDTDLGNGQVHIVEPGDEKVGRKLEPESRGILHTLIRSHVALGLLGVVVGLVAAGVLVVTGQPLFTTNLYYLYGLLAAFGGVAGLLLGGLISLRPDHDPLIYRVEKAARDGEWAVVVHARTVDQERSAKHALESMSRRVIGAV